MQEVWLQAQGIWLVKQGVIDVGTQGWGGHHSQAGASVAVASWRSHMQQR